ncbi:MAG: LysR family transcriptional regulator [Burkholderiales bacterium]|nr:LysR family transcriptional regulator [Burkholderiales bacterium]
MRIDPRRLLDLLAVARHGSFSAAAEALNVSQPGLSQSIAQLEHGLGGVRLLERDRHGARLTGQGEALAFHARALEALLGRAKEQVRLGAAGIQGPLAIGVTPVTAASLVPQALAALLQATPQVAVSVVEGLDDELLGMLRARELDIVVCRLRGALEGLASALLTSAGWSLIVAPTHRLAARGKVALNELVGERWVLPASGSAFRRQMEMVFEAAGLPWPDAGISTNSIPAIKSIVMATGSVALMSPALASVECEAGRLCAVPLVEAAPLQPVGMVWRGDDEPSPIATRFMRLLREVAGAPAGPPS